MMTSVITKELDSGGWGGRSLSCEAQLMGVQCGHIYNEFSIVPNCFIAITPQLFSCTTH